MAAPDELLSNDATESSDDSPEAVAGAWAEEIEKRVAEVLDGKVELIDEHEVNAKIEARLEAMRAKPR